MWKLLRDMYKEVKEIWQYVILWEGKVYSGSGRSLEGGHSTPLQYSFLENPVDRRVWQAIVHWVAESDMAEQLTHTHIPLPSISKNKPST